VLGNLNKQGFNTGEFDPQVISETVSREPFLKQVRQELT
jgi:hypothetical protein